jgi:hypothetical protein
MSSLTWAEAIALQHRPLSPERMRAELMWAEITGKSVGQPLPERWWTPPPLPAPASPRGRGKRKPETKKVVAVERKGERRMLHMPDGRMIAGSRRKTQEIIILKGR